MVSLAGRWRAQGVRSGARGMRRSDAPMARLTPGNSLALAFEQLCAQLKRPFSRAEIKAAAPPTEAGLTLGGVLLAAERLGFKARQVKPRRRALAQIPTPFLLVGHRPGEGWLVRARLRDHLVLVDPASGRESVTQPRERGRSRLARRPAETLGRDRHPPAAGSSASSNGATRSCGACARCCGSSASPRS